MARRHVVDIGGEYADKAKRREHDKQVASVQQGESLLDDEKKKIVELDLPVSPKHGQRLRSAGSGGFYSKERIKQLPHRFTSVDFACLYPFLTGTRDNPMGIPLGIDRETEGLWCFDPWRWYKAGLIPSTGILIMGGYRQGKSWFLKRFIANLVAIGYQAINTSDSKGEHVGLADALGGIVYEVGAPGSTLRINGLDAGSKPEHLTDTVWETSVQQRRSLLLQQIIAILLGDSGKLSPAERNVIDFALRTANERMGGKPTIRMVYQVLGEVLSGEVKPVDLGDLVVEAKNMRHALYRLVQGDLAGMFEDESTVTLTSESPYIVFNTFWMAQRGDTALAITQAITQSWVQSILQDKKSGRQWIVAREEGWRDMNSVPALEAQRVQQKLAGEYGICQVLVVHEGGDFDAVGATGSQERALAEQLAKGFAVKISFAQEIKQLEASAKAVGLTGAQTNLIRDLVRGECVVSIGTRAMLIDTKPLSTSWEFKHFDTNAAMTVKEDGES